MASLLAKFRIDYSDVTVIPDITKKASPETRKKYMVRREDGALNISHIFSK